MLILVTYDVSTLTAAGEKRLRQVAKICAKYGKRVQNSVFECMVNNEEYILLKHCLEKIIDRKVDNIRFYNLGNKYQGHVEIMGIKRIFELDEPFII